MKESGDHQSISTLPQNALPLVIGIGSSHGDDCVGWEVVDRLILQPDSKRLGVFRKAAVPHDILDWFDCGRTTHIVDAIISNADQPLRLTVAHNLQGDLIASFMDESGVERTCGFPRLQSNSTHQFDLLSVLQLSHALGTMPAELVLWALPICLSKIEVDYQPTRVRLANKHAVLQGVRRITQELSHA